MYLPKNLWERATYTMEENPYNLNELHLVLLDLMKKFDSICKKYKIEYSIGFGTMLGAIRHQGFIPWDDDVDILITRKEYEKLTKVPAEEYDNKYFFQTIETDKNYPYNTARLRLNGTAMIYEKWINSGFHQGIYIDIIPLDNVPDIRIKEYWQKLQIIFLTPFRFARNKNVFFNCGKNIPYSIKKIIYIIISKFPLSQIYQKEVNVEKKYMNNQTKRIAFLGEGNLLLKKWYPTQTIPSKAMKEFLYVRFEDTYFMCSKQYKQLLKQWYGNYMKLPSEDKRQVYHQPLFFSTSTSYDEYFKNQGHVRC